MARPLLSDHLHGAVHRARVDRVLVEEEGRDDPRVPEKLARVPAGLVPAEDVLQVPLRDAVHQYLVTPSRTHQETPDGYIKAEGVAKKGL